VNWISNPWSNLHSLHNLQYYIIQTSKSFVEFYVMLLQWLYILARIMRGPNLSLSTFQIDKIKHAWWQGKWHWLAWSIAYGESAMLQSLKVLLHTLIAPFFWSSCMYTTICILCTRLSWLLWRLRPIDRDLRFLLLFLLSPYSVPTGWVPSSLLN
jgi:hypothetical protein